MNLQNLFGQMKRRHVYRVAIAYAFGGWALAQGIAQVFPVFDVPNWVIRLLVVLIVIGFPVALILAWAFELTPEGIKRTEDVDPVAQGRSRKRIWIYVIIIGAFVSIALFFLGRYTAGNKTESLDHISNKSIAVLPLLNESGDPGDEYFSDGLSEELIAALAQIRGLKVIGRSSSFRFKDKKQDRKAIGEKLGVSTLLEGTVRKQGEQVRIVAELVNAADGSELWSRTYDREIKDIFAVQTEIARAVATSLQLTLLAAEDFSKNAATKSAEAHNAYLEGHFFFQRRNLEDYRKAVGFFDQAILLDPEYALAYAERSEAWTWIGDQSSENQKEAWAAAGSDAEKAVAIDPGLSEAHAALGWVRFFAEWKFGEGLAELRQANQLSPWNANANDLLARVVVYLGQFEEAEQLARQAMELDPLAFQARTSLARVLFVEGKLDEAEAAARKAAELQPTGASSHRWQVLVAIMRNDGETALREAQLEPNDAYRRFELALAHYARRDRRAADAALAELVAKDRNVL